MGDLRYDLANEVCDVFRFQLFPGHCDRCRYPLVEDRAVLLPFCWFCACDKEQALRGRAALLKARLTAQGFLIKKESP